KTECERLTGTMENRSTCPPISAILMTADRPASPPPTTMIFGLAAMIEVVESQWVHGESHRIQAPFRFAGGATGGVLRNASMETVPTVIKTTATSQQTTANLRRARSPAKMPHFAANSHKPYPKCQDAAMMPTK